MKQIQRTLLVLLIACIALGLRLRAVERLPTDYDEDDYLAAAQRYADAFRKGDLEFIENYRYIYEHPLLTKLIYGLALLPLPEVDFLPQAPVTDPPNPHLPQPHLLVARLVSALIGALSPIVLALINPLAGLMLAIHTYQIKYTSQVMLESLPLLTSMLAVHFYMLSKGRSWKWLTFSAIALGLTAAAKYNYAMVGIVILAHWLWTQRAEGPLRKPSDLINWLGKPVLWGVLSLAVFVAAFPRLWAAPLPRLIESIQYWLDYNKSLHVDQAGYPPWQPLVWLAISIPWHPGVFMLSLDPLISLFALLGYRRLAQDKPVYALWLIIGLGMLLIWNTKWPQYILILLVPLSLAAAEGFTAKVWDPFLRWIIRLSSRAKSAWGRDSRSSPAGVRPIARPERSQLRQALPWLLPGLLALAIIAIFPLLYQGAMALTDFNAVSIKDGIQGGVWRAVRQGLTGQEPVIQFNPFDFQANRSKTVHYAGPALLLELFLGAAADILVFNVIWTVLSVLFQAALGIAVALVLNRPGVRLRNLWRTIFILPWAIPEFVGALVWLRFFEPDNGWLALTQQLPAGVVIPNFFENASSTLMVLLIAATWYGFPIVFLAATAGLKLIPEDVYDAAAIDGAGRWHTFRHVTWPLLLPLVAPALIIRSIFAFNQFYLFYTLPTPYPLTTFATISYYFFSPSGNYGGQFAVSAAINIFTVIILVAFISAFNRWSRASEGVTYA